MASTMSCAAVVPASISLHNGLCGQNLPSSRSFNSPSLVSRSRIVMSASSPKNQAESGGAVALALLAACVIPEIAEAAQPGISPSLKNLLLSVVAGGTVLLVIGVAVAGVSTFDPVQRK